MGSGEGMKMLSQLSGWPAAGDCFRRMVHRNEHGGNVQNPVHSDSTFLFHKPSFLPLPIIPSTTAAPPPISIYWAIMSLARHCLGARDSDVQSSLTNGRQAIESGVTRELVEVYMR